jgi:hypothetical protein
VTLRKLCNSPFIHFEVSFRASVASEESMYLIRNAEILRCAQDDIPEVCLVK